MRAGHGLRLVIGDIGHDDVRALVGQAMRQCLAQPLACAGDDGDFALPDDAIQSLMAAAPSGTRPRPPRSRIVRAEFGIDLGQRLLQVLQVVSGKSRICG